MAFIGAINRDMRSMISELVPKDGSLPLYVGCSGNFTIERIIAGMGVKEIHISLYSCAVGSYLTGHNLDIWITY
jgi:Phage DNA Adenine Methylase-like domain 1